MRLDAARRSDTTGVDHTFEDQGHVGEGEGEGEGFDKYCRVAVGSVLVVGTRLFPYLNSTRMTLATFRGRLSVRGTSLVYRLGAGPNGIQNLRASHCRFRELESLARCCTFQLNS